MYVCANIYVVYIHGKGTSYTPYTHTYIHTYIHTYTHPYIHTHIHTYMSIGNYNYCQRWWEMQDFSAMTFNKFKIPFVSYRDLVWPDYAHPPANLPVLW